MGDVLLVEMKLRERGREKRRCYEKKTIFVAFTDLDSKHNGQQNKILTFLNLV
jgi:hypothetical protein